MILALLQRYRLSGSGGFSQLNSHLGSRSKLRSCSLQGRNSVNSYQLLAFLAVNFQPLLRRPFKHKCRESCWVSVTSQVLVKVAKAKSLKFPDFLSEKIHRGRLINAMVVRQRGGLVSMFPLAFCRYQVLKISFLENVHTPCLNAEHWGGCIV